MRKLRTRILVGAAVATFAGTAAFAAVSMTDDATAANTVALSTSNTTATTNNTTANTAVTAKTGTALSVAVSKPTIAAGRLDVISGTLTTGSIPSARRIVELYRLNSKTGKWVPVRVNLTHKGGAVRFAVRPLATAEYEMVYHGSAKLAASRSAEVTITVTG
jgi:hypothetical protein